MTLEYMMKVYEHIMKFQTLTKTREIYGTYRSHDT